MIKVTVREAARKRGISSAYKLAQALGDEGRTTASVLWKGKEIPSLRTLDRVAEVLGDCDLSELITRLPNKKRRKSPTRQDGSKKTHNYRSR